MHQGKITGGPVALLYSGKEPEGFFRFPDPVQCHGFSELDVRDILRERVLPEKLVIQVYGEDEILTEKPVLGLPEQVLFRLKGVQRGECDRE